MILKGFEMSALSGLPISGATVELFTASDLHPNPNAALTSTPTDAQGMWQFAGLVDGDYDVKVSVPGESRVKWLKGKSRVSAAIPQVADWLPRNNVLVDGGFEKWAFTTSLAVAASVSTTAGYGGGNFCLKTNANQASVIDQIAGITTNSLYASRVRRNAGQTGTGVMVYEQPLTTDDIIKFGLRGQLVSVTFTVKAGANWSPTSGNLTARVACGTGAQSRRGAGFTGETTLINQTVAVTAGGAAQTVQFTSTVVVPVNATQMSVSFEWTPVGTAGAADDITFDDVALIAGVPQAFSPRWDDDKAFGRRARKLGGVGAEIGFYANGTAGISIGYGVSYGEEMIATPTVTKVGTWTVSNCGQPGVQAVGKTYVLMFATTTATSWMFWTTTDTTTYLAVDARF